jgi:membrane-associated protein
MTDATADRGEPFVARARRLLRSRTVLIVAAGVALVGVIAFVLNGVGGRDGLSLVQESVGGWAYLACFFLVLLDAVFPIFPGETTLNAASTLAAQGSLELDLVILAGALGAIVGDSALYWIARLSSRRVQPQLDKAKQNEKVAAALDFLGSSAPLLLVVGRYVPGLRFVVNATMGLSAYPYRRFLLWSSIGGVLWATYTCALAYAVGTALSDFPLASVVISGFITTAALAVLFVVVVRRQRKRRPEIAASEPEPSAGA